MKKFITDIHGLFNPEELESIPEDQLAEKAFKEMDADQDGHITEEEFIQAALKDNKVCKMLALKVVNLISPWKNKIHFKTVLYISNNPKSTVLENYSKCRIWIF